MFKVIVRNTYDEVSAEAFKVIQEVMQKEHPVLGRPGQRRWACIGR